MKFNLKSAIKLTEANKEYLQKKMDSLDKYLGKIKAVDCRVDIGMAINGQKTGEIYRVEVLLYLPNFTIMVEKVETDLLKAIDKVKEHVARSIVKHKEKVIERRRKTQSEVLSE